MLKKKGFICMMALFLLLLGSAQVKAEFKVYDANGQYLGILVGLRYSRKPYIFIPSLKAILGVTISGDSENGIIYSPDTDFYYKNNSCSGMAYVNASYTAFLYIGEICDMNAPHSNLALYLIDPKKMETCKAESLFLWDTVYDEKEGVYKLKCVNLKETSEGKMHDYISVIPLTSFSEDQLPFKLPIKLPLRLEYVPGGFDISGDSKIGLEEAIYSLQVAAGLRANPNTK